MTPPPEIKDIAPPIDVFPYPMWMVLLAATLVALLLAVAATLAWKWWRNRPKPPPPTPRAIALEKLRNAGAQIATVTPDGFSILVSDILRAYVSERYQLRATRQTSPEFLNDAAKSPRFSESEKSLLASFLDRCDLIKFAHIHASTEDSSRLLDQALQFVNGGAS